MSTASEAPTLRAGPQTGLGLFPQNRPRPTTPPQLMTAHPEARTDKPLPALQETRLFLSRHDRPPPAVPSTPAILIPNS